MKKFNLYFSKINMKTIVKNIRKYLFIFSFIIFKPIKAYKIIYDAIKFNKVLSITNKALGKDNLKEVSQIIFTLNTMEKKSECWKNVVDSLIFALKRYKLKKKTDRKFDKFFHKMLKKLYS